MFGSPILDVAIGMAFVYLLLSLIASALQEILASFTQARAANLQRGLRSLFSNDKFNSGESLVSLIYDHGLIRGLYQDPDRDFTVRGSFGEVTYALWKALMWVKGAFRVLLGLKPPGVSFKPADILLPSYIPSRAFALALIDILNDPKPHGWDSLKNIEKNLSDLQNKHKDNKAVQALLALVKDAAGKPEKLQTNIENWYNDSMDRVSGWYKHYAQKILIIIGIVLAFSFNVDSIRVAQVLWTDKDTRTATLAAATDYLQKHPDSPKGTNRTSESDKSKDARVASADSSDQNNAKGTTDDQKVLQAGDLKQRLQTTIDEFHDASKSSMLPVGWTGSPLEALHRFWNSNNPDYAKLARMLSGWLITAIAISLGAPFWFDTLNKFMVVRGTVKPQEKSQTEKSKDG